MSKQRLQELAGITELNVNKPKSKMDILNEILDFNPYFIKFLNPFKSEQELNDEYGDNISLEELYSEIEFSYEDEYLKKAIELTELYFIYIKPGDIHIIEKDIEPIPPGYKNIHNWRLDDDDEDSTVFITKF